MNKVTIVLSVLITLLINLGCRKENRQCLAPPPTLDFSIVDPENRSLITASNAGSVKVYYLNKNGLKTYITDLKVATAAGESSVYYVSSTEIISTANKISPTAFKIEISGSSTADLYLKTAINDSDCNGWAYISEVKFNGEVVEYKPFTPVIFKFKN